MTATIVLVLLNFAPITNIQNVEMFHAQYFSNLREKKQRDFIYGYVGLNFLYGAFKRKFFKIVQEVIEMPFVGYIDSTRSSICVYIERCQFASSHF